MSRSAHAVLFTLFSIAAPLTFAQDAAEAIPPLIDREIFFGDPELAGATISPDGEHIAFMKPYEGVRNVWVKRTDAPFDSARPVTADVRRPIPQFFWSRDGRYVLFVQDRDGDENYNLYAVDPNAEPEDGDGVPEARNLTEAENVRVALYALPKDDPDTAYIGLNDRDAAWHDLYALTLSTGELSLLRDNTERVSNWVFDLDGELRLAVRAPESGETQILRVDDDGFSPLYVCGVFESCNPVRFHGDDRRVYMITNRGDDVDLIRLTLLDVQNGNETPVESDPEGRVDLSSVIFSDRTDELVGTVYVEDRPRIYWRDDAWEADYETLRERLPGLEIGIGSSTLDERLWIVNASGDVEPGETYLFDRENATLTLQYQIRERLPREHLAPMTPIRYTSSDGLEIPAYLTLPKGVEPRGLPVVVVPHGGPWARDTWGYRAIPQFLANRGYAVLQPNFRGSSGYGKAFLDAGNAEWGDKMQDDITWGVRHLLDEGIADPERVGIFGGSYGGYATLAGLAFTPDLYAAGVSLVGPSNLMTLLDSIPPYWEAMRTTLHERVGDPADPEDRARLERQSPLFSADEISAPLLVIQGANDPRVKKAESEQIVVALRERGFPVEYLLAPDEGHGFARPVNNLAAMAAAERFFAIHLDGRHQEGGSPEVMQRLEEIRVDPATVELPAELDRTTLEVPRPAFELEPGVHRYAVKIEAGGQSMDLTSQIEIEEQDDAWIITETATTPAGPATDRTELDKDGLVVARRSILQGPVSIELEVSDDGVTGEMNVNGQRNPIDVPLDGPLFADGGGAGALLATLPLEEGYTTAFRNLNLQNQTLRPVRLAVVGSEQVTVPVGSFDAFTVELTSPEDGNQTTVWVGKATRKVLKSVTTGPQLNGAVMTAELIE